MFKKATLKINLKVVSMLVMISMVQLFPSSCFAVRYADKDEDASLPNQQ